MEVQLGCVELVRHVVDLMDKLLTHVQILALFNSCDHEDSYAVSTGHEV